MFLITHPFICDLVELALRILRCHFNLIFRTLIQPLQGAQNCYFSNRAWLKCSLVLNPWITKWMSSLYVSSLAFKHFTRVYGWHFSEKRRALSTWDYTCPITAAKKTSELFRQSLPGGIISTFQNIVNDIRKYAFRKLYLKIGEDKLKMTTTKLTVLRCLS